MNGVHAVVFTAGIGENSGITRNTKSWTELRSLVEKLMMSVTILVKKH